MWIGAVEGILREFQEYVSDGMVVGVYGYTRAGRDVLACEYVGVASGNGVVWVGCAVGGLAEEKV